MQREEECGKCWGWFWLTAGGQKGRLNSRYWVCSACRSQELRQGGWLRGSVCSSSAAPSSCDLWGFRQTSPGQVRGDHGTAPSHPSAAVSQYKMQFCGYFWEWRGFRRAVWGSCFAHTDKVPIAASQEVSQESRTRFTTTDTSSANTLCTCAASQGGLSQFLTRYKTFYNEISRWLYKSKASHPAPWN